MVTLQKDTSISSITIDKTIVLNLSGNTVSSSNPELFVVSANGDLTIQ
ncbi:hypothetical protein IJU97_04905 [bacterium]|nr:hypothetical protein [bacterium]